MANPSPSSNVSAGFATAGTGAVSLVWGTSGYFSLGYIVKSIRASDVNEIIYIENGTGLRAKRINLVQGREYEITVEDDSNIAAPAIASVVALIDPLSNWVSKNITVLDANWNGARKQNGERVVKCVYDTLIEGGGVIP